HFTPAMPNCICVGVKALILAAAQGRKGISSLPPRPRPPPGCAREPAYCVWTPASPRIHTPERSTCPSAACGGGPPGGSGAGCSLPMILSNFYRKFCLLSPGGKRNHAQTGKHRRDAHYTTEGLSHLKTPLY